VVGAASAAAVAADYERLIEALAEATHR